MINSRSISSVSRVKVHKILGRDLLYEKETAQQGSAILNPQLNQYHRIQYRLHDQAVSAIDILFICRNYYAASVSEQQANMLLDRHGRLPELHLRHGICVYARHAGSQMDDKDRTIKHAYESSNGSDLQSR